MLSLRDAYILPAHQDAIEFRAFTHGLMPATVPAMMQHFINDWQQRGVDAWNNVPNHWRPKSGDTVGWWTLPVYLGDHYISPLLGVEAGTCIMQPNVHWTVQCILSARELFAQKRKVILTEAEFPSVSFTLQQWADIHNLEILQIPLQGNTVDEAAVLDAIDDKTALVILSHVGFTTGEKLADAFIRDVADTIHQHGGLLAIDGYHSIGSLTTSVAALDIDLYFGGLLKEGSGSSGNAYLYLKPGLQLTPRLTGWFGDAAPFAFDKRPLPHPDTRMRFLGGTTAVAALYHAVEGVKVLLDAGLDAVRNDAVEKTDLCIALADQLGLQLRSPRLATQRSAMVVFEIPQSDRMAQYLKTHQIFVDSRQGCYLRLSPFVWNTEAEIQRTFSILKKGLAGARYIQTQLSSAGGPVT
ncbi:MAG: aminotransferase class V-fold PLP-dependent enzyme [Bacteroidota bacterium]